MANASAVRVRDCRTMVTFRMHVAIGASGAASASTAVNGSLGYDDPQLSCTKSATGTYALVFPKGKRVFPQFTIYSPLLTAIAAVVTAKDATAGTMTFKTVDAAGAAVEPASGDELFIKLEVAF